MRAVDKSLLSDAVLGDSARWFRDRAGQFERSNCPAAGATALTLAAEYEAELDRRIDARQSVHTRSAIFNTRGQS